MKERLEEVITTNTFLTQELDNNSDNNSLLEQDIFYNNYYYEHSLTSTLLKNVKT